MSAVLFLSLFAGAAGWPHSVSRVSAASYDYYVEAGENGDGSEDDPFGSIKDAVDEIGDKEGKKIYVKPGTYSAAFTLPKGTTLVGSDAKDVSITGLVTLSNDTTVSKISISGAGGLLVLKNASVTLERIRIKGVVGTGLKSEAGKARIILRDSLIEGNRKGAYLQAGTTFEASGLEVVKNREEGIDIRENVDGSITKSSFHDNEESGLEIVLGSAKFSISGNTFTSNGASGVAAQFYDGAKKLGNVSITGNTFTRNDWGIDCKAPQGNMDSKFYFLNSLTVENNTFKENRDGEISGRCKILTDAERAALEAEEAKQKAALDERVAALTLSDAALADRMAQATAARKASLDAAAEQEKRAVEVGLQAVDQAVNEANGLLTQTGARRQSWRCYLIGSGYADDWYASAAGELKRVRERLENEQLALRLESSQTQVAERLQSLRALDEKLAATAALPRCSFSFLGWLGRFFQTDKPPMLLGSATDRLTWLGESPRDKVLWIGTLAYFPKVREVAVRSGDQRLFEALASVRGEYRDLLADIRLPLGTEADPLPLVTATAELPLPLRYANVLATILPSAIHASFAPQAAPDLKTLDRTRVNLGYADIKSFGRFDGYEREHVSVVGSRPVRWLTVFESDATALQATRDRLGQLSSEGADGVVVLVWDEKQGKSLTSERRALAKGLAQVGARLIIGTGLMLPMETEKIGEAHLYYSTGSPFALFQSGESSSKAVALELARDADVRLTVTERPIVFTAERGLELR